MRNPELNLIKEFAMTRVTVPKEKPERREVPLIPPLPIRETKPNPIPVTQPPVRKPEPVPITR